MTSATCLCSVDACFLLLNCSFSSSFATRSFAMTCSSFRRSASFSFFSFRCSLRSFSHCLFERCSSALAFASSDSSARMRSASASFAGNGSRESMFSVLTLPVDEDFLFAILVGEGALDYLRHAKKAGTGDPGSKLNEVKQDPAPAINSLCTNNNSTPP
ncbi:hypothetical protein BD626DRAFT_510320 [Schizophyllum amplum]|uniref:Uncharacterized protein n=1 Tax=Schizophyllum amplum TaxID=97359 RepID=A0A550C1R6_9AGAR|nr:hypothetical protein BD626DRAFT_510320 [Auriculariopsis ampla]